MASIQIPSSFTFPGSKSFTGSPSFSNSPVSPGPAVFVFEGDSLTANNNNGITPYPDKLLLQSNFLRKGPQYNVAITGDTIQNISGNSYSEQIKPLKFPSCSFKDFYVFIWAGTNDLGVRTAAQIYADLQTFWAAAKADGFKVVAFTISKRAAPNALSGPNETKRQDVNTSIKSNLTLFNYLIDVDVLFPDASDLTYFYDGLHNTDAGTLLIAQNINTIFTP